MGYQETPFRKIMVVRVKLFRKGREVFQYLLYILSLNLMSDGPGPGPRRGLIDTNGPHEQSHKNRRFISVVVLDGVPQKHSDLPEYLI